jgi:hypothetical protein
MLNFQPVPLPAGCGPSKEQEAWFVVTESVAQKVFCDSGGWVFARHPWKREKEIVSGYEAVFDEPPPNTSQRPG